MLTVRIDGSVIWLVAVTESEVYVSYCEELGLATQANTWHDLMENIDDAMSLLFASLVKEGDMDGFFADKGWIKPEGIEDDTRFDIPFIPQQVDSHEYATAISN